MEKVVVYGLGSSGRAAVELLLKNGVTPYGYDDQLSFSHPSIAALCQQGLQLFDHTNPESWKGIAYAVISPGISSKTPFFQQLQHHQIDLVGEAEFSLRHLRQPAIAITGTNGKTTVTLLCEHILQCCGMKAKALGNVGTPFSSYLCDPDPEEIVVAELSSYQLETLSCKVFQGAVILNITPDHLDRYTSMEEYARAKWKIEESVQEGGNLFVSERTAQLFGSLSKRRNFTLFGFNEESYYTQSKGRITQEKIATFLPLSYRMKGKHEWENALAAWLLCRDFGVRAEQFSSFLESFSRPAHRIEYVATINGVDYFDDSKGTNVDAVVQAVKSMKTPPILIVGGVDKGGGYSLWKEALQGEVKTLLALGQAASIIEDELKDFFSIERVFSLEEAVQRAASIAVPGDTVLLSPGCSSYDMFRDYKHRGDEFKRIVYLYKNGAPTIA